MHFSTSLIAALASGAIAFPAANPVQGLDGLTNVLKPLTGNAGLPVKRDYAYGGEQKEETTSCTDEEYAKQTYPAASTYSAPEAKVTYPAVYPTHEDKHAYASESTTCTDEEDPKQTHPAAYPGQDDKNTHPAVYPGHDDKTTYPPSKETYPVLYPGHNGTATYPSKETPYYPGQPSATYPLTSTLTSYYSKPTSTPTYPAEPEKPSPECDPTYEDCEIDEEPFPECDPTYEDCEIDEEPIPECNPDTEDCGIDEEPIPECNPDVEDCGVDEEPIPECNPDVEDCGVDEEPIPECNPDVEDCGGDVDPLPECDPADPDCVILVCDPEVQICEPEGEPIPGDGGEEFPVEDFPVEDFPVEVDPVETVPVDGGAAQAIQCGAGNAVSCCNSAATNDGLLGVVLGGSCSLQVPVLAEALGNGCNAANTFCCPTSQNGFINVGAPCIPINL